MFTTKDRLRMMWFEAIGTSPFFGPPHPKRCSLCDRLLKLYSQDSTVYIFDYEEVMPICKRHANRYGTIVSDCLTTERKSLILPHGQVIERLIWYRDEALFWVGAAWRFGLALPIFFLRSFLYRMSELFEDAYMALERN